MNKHKQKCDKLKQVRKDIADKIGVDLHQKECTFSGDCTGTCPKCKQEEEILNKSLLKKAGLAALSTGMTFSLAACGPKSDPNEILMGVATPEIETVEPLQGDIEAPSTNEPLTGDIESVTINDTCTVEQSSGEESTEQPELPLEPLMGVAPYEGE